MISRHRALARALTAACVALPANAFLSIPFNTNEYFGPDGPWQAVTLQIQNIDGEGAFTTVNLLPSIIDPIALAFIPTEYSCIGYPNDGCGSGGTIPFPANINTDEYAWWATWDNLTHWRYNFTGPPVAVNLELPSNLNQSGVSVVAAANMNVMYPNGNIVPQPCGAYSLGGPNVGGTVSTPASAYSSNFTESNSVGLHVGAAVWDYPGSLIFGGYDTSRMIGPPVVYSQGNTGAATLLDIVIGVETGGSPFNFTSQDNLLKASSSATSAESLPAFPFPYVPYIYAPPATVEAITALLPVNFDSSSGYYLWNTNDPMYSTVVNSPAYLGFVFSTNDTDQVTIKIPFGLLNLTLETSITGSTSEQPYFPIMPVIADYLPQDAVWLGRAFLQGAYWLVNWETNVTWLAQAPGPGSNGNGLGSYPLNLQNDQMDLSIQSGDTLFNQSWAGYWTVLANGTTSSSSKSGLSGGAIGGIVVGVVAGLALLGAIIFFVLRRRRQNNKEVPKDAQNTQETSHHQEYAPVAVASPQMSEHQPYQNQQQQYQQQNQHNEMEKNGYDYRHPSLVSPTPQYDNNYQYPGSYADQYYHMNELPGHSSMPSELPGSSAHNELDANDHNISP